MVPFAAVSVLFILMYGNSYLINYRFFIMEFRPLDIEIPSK